MFWGGRVVVPNNDRIEFANSLRGVACIAVVWTHLSGASWFLRSGSELADKTNLAPIPADVAWSTLAAWVNWFMQHPFYPGQFAVGLFFLISGFVIPFSFDTLNRKQFVITRFFRIWPTYAVGFLLSVGFLAAVLWLQGRSFPFTGSAIAFHSFVGLRDLLRTPFIDQVLWTLEVEFRFYFVVMLLGPILWRRASLLVFLAPLAIFVAGLIVAALWSRNTSSMPLFRIVVLSDYSAYVIFIFIGAALNFYYRGRQSLLATAMVVATLLLASGYLASILLPTIFPVIWPNYLFALVVFVTCMKLRGLAWDVAPLSFLAAISYPLYITHNLIGCAIIDMLIVNFGFSANASLVAGLVAVIPIAYALHIALEEPTRKLGKRIIREGIDLATLRGPLIGQLGRMRAAASGIRAVTAQQIENPAQVLPKVGMPPMAGGHGFPSER